MKKLISTILILMCFLNISIQSYAEYDTQVKAVNELEISLLRTFGIIKDKADSVFNPEKSVSKAEFTEMLMRSLGVSDFSTGNINMVFKDVDMEHWAAGYILAAKELGIVTGDSLGNFYPDEPIYLEQAAKMMVYSLGYELYAKNKGGYPVGYMMVANELKITKDMKLSIKTITGNDAAKLIYNSLDVDLMIPTGFGSKEKFEITNNKTLLTEKLKLNKESGIITGTYITRLSGDSSLAKDEIEFGKESKIISVGKTEAKKFLGYYATIYYSEDKNTGKYTAVYIEVDKNKNNVQVIPAEKIRNYNQNTLLFWKDEDKTEDKKVLLSKKVDVLYNGKAYLDYDDSSFIPETGEVVLVDNNNDGTYEVVFIKEYENYVVGIT